MNWNWFNKLKLNTKLFLNYLGIIMYNGDKTILHNNEDKIKNSTNVECKQEQDSVYNDLLHQNITQEVIELRHEMYFSERESRKYEYTGGGKAIKKNNIFKYSGKYEDSDELDIYILQPNYLDSGELVVNKEKDAVNNALKTAREYHYTINIKRDFIPRFRLEQYTTKIIVKKPENGKAILDLYVTKYQSQYNRIHRPFLNEVEKIKNGFLKTDVIDFNELSFISRNAYGTDDLKLYEFNNIKFINIIEFDGSNVFKFEADVINDGKDLIEEFYDEATANKSNKHEKRKNATLDLTNDFIEKMSNDEASEIISMIQNIKKTEN